MPTKITLIRHGETEWNIAMRLQGKKDSPLTNKGLEQIRKVAIALKNSKPNILFSSDLKRAMDTALEINKYLNMEILPNIELRERNFGIMEGLNIKVVEKTYPETYYHYINRTADYDIPEGESLNTFNTRIIQEIEKLALEHTGKHILIVAHGGVLDCMIRHTFNYPLDANRNFSVYNASISNFRIDGKNWILEQWGNIDHLKNVGTKNEFS